MLELVVIKLPNRIWNTVIYRLNNNGLSFWWYGKWKTRNWTRWD